MIAMNDVIVRAVEMSGASPNVVLSPAAPKNSCKSSSTQAMPTPTEANKVAALAMKTRSQLSAKRTRSLTFPRDFSGAAAAAVRVEEHIV